MRRHICCWHERTIGNGKRRVKAADAWQSSEKLRERVIVDVGQRNQSRENFQLQLRLVEERREAQSGVVGDRCKIRLFGRASERNASCNDKRNQHSSNRNSNTQACQRKFVLLETRHIPTRPERNRY